LKNIGSVPDIPQNGKTIPVDNKKTINETVGFAFPAFAKAYRGFNPEAFGDYLARREDYVNRAAKLVQIDPQRFERACNGIIEDDLHAHYSCYINSCVISDILKGRRIRSDFVAPFSMGLYAALYHTSAVTFEDGLFFIHHQLTSALKMVDDAEYGMASIVGFPSDQIERFILKNCTDVEVVDSVNELGHVVAGKKKEIEKLLIIANENGSLNTRMLPVILPYHSSFMQKVKGEIEKTLAKIDIRSPECPIISAVDQKILANADDVRVEMSKNIIQKVSWFKTMNKFLTLGVTLFVECGISGDLSKLVKISPYGDNVKTYHPKTYTKLFQDFNF
jgi:[acyl-carrier-protein] S-malonyltransferase